MMSMPALPDVYGRERHGDIGIGLSSEILKCPICVETIQDPFVTSCGHTFCYPCINTHLKNKHSCPSCSNYLTRDHIFPNFLLNKILHRANVAVLAPSAPLLDSVRQSLANTKPRVPEIDKAIQLLQEKKDALHQQERANNFHMLLLFLQHARGQKEIQLDELQQQLQLLAQDLQSVGGPNDRAMSEAALAALGQLGPSGRGTAGYLQPAGHGVGVTGGSPGTEGGSGASAQMAVGMQGMGMAQHAVRGSLMPPPSIAQRGPPAAMQQMPYGGAPDSGMGDVRRSAFVPVPRSHAADLPQSQLLRQGSSLSAHSERLVLAAAGSSVEQAVADALGRGQSASGSATAQDSLGQQDPLAVAHQLHRQQALMWQQAQAQQQQQHQAQQQQQHAQQAQQAALQQQQAQQPGRPGSLPPILQHAVNMAGGSGMGQLAAAAAASGGMPQFMMGPGSMPPGMRPVHMSGTGFAPYGMIGHPAAGYPPQGLSRPMDSSTPVPSSVPSMSGPQQPGGQPPVAASAQAHPSMAPGGPMAPAPLQEQQQQEPMQVNVRAVVTSALTILPLQLQGQGQQQQQQQQQQPTSGVSPPNGAGAAAAASEPGEAAGGSSGEQVRKTSAGHLGSGGSGSQPGAAGREEGGSAGRYHYTSGDPQQHQQYQEAADAQFERARRARIAARPVAPATRSLVTGITAASAVGGGGQARKAARGRPRGDSAVASSGSHDHEGARAGGGEEGDAAEDAEQQDAARASKKRRMMQQYEQLEQCYLEMRAGARPEPRTGAALGGESDTREGLTAFSEMLSAATHYGKLDVVASIPVTGGRSSSSILSSIEFDMDAQHFATAGVLQRISIYDYSAVTGHHAAAGDAAGGGGGDSSGTAPLLEMRTRSKLSCLSYSPTTKPHLLSSDYEGVVALWDTASGQLMTDWEAHDKRIWSVDFNAVEPGQFVSGSDDGKVKIWSVNQRSSSIDLDIKANVCTVKFNPALGYSLAVGSAGHTVMLYDLRAPRAPLHVLSGHRKAVSYVRWLGPEELVSASTDSTLRLWNTEEGTCVRTFQGHTNEKNFVGLSAIDSQFIACGSETNEVFVYYKGIPTPSVQYCLGGSGGSGSSSGGGPNHFISALCWRPNSNVLLAANSQGSIWVLSLQQ